MHDRELIVGLILGVGVDDDAATAGSLQALLGIALVACPIRRDVVSAQ
jgi:hypothetical protein